MIFLSILIALVMERVFPQFVEARRFDWLRDYSQWLQDALHIERFGGWGSLAVLLLPMMLVLWMVSGMFGNALFGLFELAFDVAVIFLCLGPKELDSQVDQYLDAVELGEAQQRYQAARNISPEVSATELSAQVIEVCKSLFVQANTRLFAVLFWFVMMGPVAALVYRVLQQLSGQNYLDATLTSMKQVIRQLLGWVDWLPTRLSLFAYMVSGNFDAALQTFRRDGIIAIDVSEQNAELLQTVGFSAITSHEVTNDAQAVGLVRKSRGLVLRSLVVWLLLLLLISAVA